MFLKQSLARASSVCLPLLLCAVATAASAQQPEVRIWPGTAPGSENAKQVESSMPFTLKPEDRIIRNVTVPTLIVFRPRKPSALGTSVIIAPGGGFLFLSFDDEGTKVAQHFADQGITAFVLKYRVAETPASDEAFIPTKPALGPDSPETRLAVWQRATKAWPKRDFATIPALGIADGVQAINYVRTHAEEWHIDPAKVVFCGFSAGAMVSSGVMLQTDPKLRPNYSVMIYGAPLGTMPPLPRDLPPMFLAYAADDPLVGDAVERFRQALHNARVKPEVHEFNAGNHGFGMSHQGTTSDHWLQELDWWMQAQHILATN